MDDHYTTQDVCNILGIKRERLREWIIKGFIKPRFPSGGQGRAASYDIADIYFIALFRHMLDRGFNRSITNKHLEELAVKIYNFSDIKYIAFFFEGSKIIPICYKEHDADNVFEVLKTVGDWTDCYLIDFVKAVKFAVDLELARLEK